MINQKREQEIIEQKQFATELIIKYPDFFLNKRWNCGSDSISINKGWFPLVIEICEKMKEFKKNNPNIHFLQIKEKFAILTVYLGGVDDINQSQIVYDALQEICDKSTKICEKCGTESNVSQKTINGYWLKTICDKCNTA